MRSPTLATEGKSNWRCHLFVPLLLVAPSLGSLLFKTDSEPASFIDDNWQAEFFPPGGTRRTAPANRGPPGEEDGKTALVVTNKCEATIWPGIATQSGTGPGTGGFELKPGETKKLTVGSSWQGRVWGRTNCTVNGESCACKTGDCFSKLDCEFSVCEGGKAGALGNENCRRQAG